MKTTIDKTFEAIDRVVFELSNRCNMAHLHPKCPVSKELNERPKNLSTEVVMRTISELAFHGFDGAISFNQYNEPLMDPRILWLLEKTKFNCPNAKTMLWSNGFCLDQGMLDDLASAGLSRLALTAYTEPDKKRFKELHSDSVKIDIFGVGWTNLFDIYDRDERGCESPCFAPLTDLTITRDGTISLCCRDWDRRYVFGDLNSQTLSDVFESGEMLDRYTELSHNQRNLDICKRCRTYRDWRTVRNPQTPITRLPSPKLT